MPSTKFPYIQQHDAMDCGPTCLRMVAKHYKKSLSIQTLRNKAEIGKEGVSLLGIAQAAEDIGFKTLAVKVSFEKLVSEAPLPCIVHWQQNHFVVVYKISKSRFGRDITVHVADPGKELLTYTKDPLRQSPLAWFRPGLRETLSGQFYCYLLWQL
ncbi:cysteine peptidase family C39 domain-containing protein [Emticicia sp. 21SJ11W-3]|uniref:cysteine peptidase family C39 domain-containing protein n=1 Tax=Emticicia sp. 21SJ11W-3 TaxID=2916755 RepID=UPI00286E32AF|nr:cysteine peptidase family C39 domain-containing protein [Emticicia sp. 21SJ11W-3]